MLVLSRKIGEKLLIGDAIEVSILDIRGDHVKIGINAPRSVTIYREELYNEIKQANKQATAPSQTDHLNQAWQAMGNKAANHVGNIPPQPPSA